MRSAYFPFWEHAPEKKIFLSILEKKFNFRSRLYKFGSMNLRIYLSTNLSTYLSFFLTVCLSDCLSVFLSVCMSLYLSFYLSIFLSACLSICLSDCLSVFLSVSLSINLSIYLPVYLFIYFSINIHVIMKTMCARGYHHNGFVATHALGHMCMTRYTVFPKCMSCHKSNVVITVRAHCFHD